MSTNAAQPVTPAADPSTNGAPAEAAAGPPRALADVAIVIPTFNEEINLPHSLRSVVGRARQVFVVDSESTDRTRDIATEAGATVVVQPWLGYAEQKNWALRNLPIETGWVFILDADESITPKLWEEIEAITARDPDTVHEAGYYINRLTYFMGKPIRHCGYFPSYNLRLFKRGRALYEDRQVHEHMVVDGPTANLKGLMHHEDRRGLEHFVAKHNRYSTLEARELIKHRNAPPHASAELEKGVALRRWLKHTLLPRLPMAGLWRFFYMYVLRLGFLDGRTGLRFCIVLSIYDTLISLKLAELRQAGDHAAFPSAPALHPAADPAPPRPSPSTSSRPPSPTGTPAREDFLARAVSPYTMRQKIARVLWSYFGQVIFRFTFHNSYRPRIALLRLFGAKIAKGRGRVRIRPSVVIEQPWNLTIGENTTIGDHAILYCLGPVTIGRDVSISQYAHLCAGTHDYTRPDFPLLRPPIVIEDHAWIGADAFVAPGVTVHEGAILGACATAFKDLEPWTIYGGNPAKPLKKRPPLPDAVDDDRRERQIP